MSRPSSQISAASSSYGVTLILALLSGILAPLTTMGGSLYVIDRLLVGLHEEKTRESAISKVVPSDTPLEILVQDKDLARVRAPDGTIGWVDMKYLTDEKPAREVVKELESWKKTRKVELAAAWEEVENLRGQVNQTDDNVPPPVPETTSASANEQLARLTEENLGLRETLDAAQQQLSALAQDRPLVDDAPPRPVSPPAAKITLTSLLEHWQWLAGALVFLLMLGFFSGSYVQDARQRRRHGGFRV